MDIKEQGVIARAVVKEIFYQNGYLVCPNTRGLVDDLAPKIGLEPARILEFMRILASEVHAEIYGSPVGKTEDRHASQGNVVKLHQPE